MLRGGGGAAASTHTQSAPQLPLASTSREERHALSKKYSTTLLPQASQTTHETTSTTAAVPAASSGFSIVEFLEAQHEQQRQTRKRANPTGAAPSHSKPRGTNGDSNSNLVPLSPIRRVHQDKSSPTKNQPSNGYVHSLERPENTELFTYASALCHRITGRYLSREVLQRDPEAQEKEIVRIQKDPELLQAIATIKLLSKEFKEIAQDTLGHRKELGHALFRIEESYLKLFEKLLELSLRMYWRYEQAHDAERQADKATIQYWQEMHNWKASEAIKLQKLVDGKEIFVRTQQIQIRDLERQCSELGRELGDQRTLEEQVFALQATERELRAKERDLQADHGKLQSKFEEMVLYQRGQLEESHSQHKRLMDDMKRALRDKEKQLTHHELAIRDLTVLTTPAVVTDRSTQTQVDDDGLWDTQDGMPRFVSKDLSHRMAWRRFNAFVRCHNCRGRPIQQPRMALRDPASKETDEDYVDVWSLSREEHKTKKMMKRIEATEREWRLPEAVMLFLSNLPKSVVAFPLYSLDLVICQIEKIYNDKFESDQEDEADGVAREELPKFICEYFLKTHGLRQSAEIGLYRFLISVKSTYQKHSHVHLFARFCDCLHDGETNDQPLSETQSGTATTGAAGTLMATLLDKPRRAYLGRSFLRAFLHARHFLYRPPPPPAKITKKFSAHAHLPLLPHVIQVDQCKSWVPLDHAVAIVRWYVGFLTEEQVTVYCREVEYSTAIYAGKSLTEITGNRLAVRAEMRKAMLANAPGEGNSLGNGKDTHTSDSSSPLMTEKERARKPRIVADVHKVLLLILHALEQRRDVMEKALVAMFDAGDVNHDCVLSLDEFKAIIRSRSASFSDRRLLRMFREALMGGSDQSFALSMDAFVKVCNDHGLVALLPDDRWNDPFHKAAVEQIAVKPAVGRLSVAAKPLTTNKDKEKPRELEEPAGKIPTALDPSTAESSEIPEDLPQHQEPPDLAVLSPRAEEVEEEGALWEW